MKPIMIFVACSALLMSTSASAATAGDFQTCTDEAFNQWNDTRAECQAKYEAGYWGPSGPWERDLCLDDAQSYYYYQIDQCRQMYPEGMSYSPESGKLFDNKPSLLS